MGYYSGSDWFMKVGGTNAATITTWSFTASQETIDITTLSDRDRKLMGGTRSVSGSASISWYSDTTNAAANTTTQTLIGNLIKTDGTASDEVDLILGITDHASTEKTITMRVILTSIAMTSSQGEVLSAEVSFEAVSAPSALTLDTP